MHLTIHLFDCDQFIYSNKIHSNLKLNLIFEHSQYMNNIKPNNQSQETITSISMLLSQ